MADSGSATCNLLKLLYPVSLARRVLGTRFWRSGPLCAVGIAGLTSISAEATAVAGLVRPYRWTETQLSPDAIFAVRSTRSGAK